jgi:hypothetical protein
MPRLYSHTFWLSYRVKSTFQHVKCHRDILNLKAKLVGTTGSILDELGINIKKFWKMEGKCVAFLQQSLRLGRLVTALMNRMADCLRNLW